MVTKKYLDTLTYDIIGGAIEVHRAMGQGLLESVYLECLKEELALRKIRFFTEMKVPVIYKGKLLDIDFRCDLWVERCLVVELKSVQQLLPIHEAQLMNYMKLLKSPKGLLINFNCPNIFHEGQKTFVNEYFTYLPAK
jgi:GxxExxY protein